MVRETKPIPSRPVNPAVNPDNIQIVTFLPGEEFYASDKRQSTPGSMQVVISYTVPADKTFYCSQVFLTCRQSACWELIADGDIIAAGNTGSGHLESRFFVNPVRPISANTVIELQFTSLTASIATTVHSFLHGGLKDLT